MTDETLDTGSRVARMQADAQADEDDARDLAFADLQGGASHHSRAAVYAATRAFATLYGIGIPAGASAPPIPDRPESPDIAMAVGKRMNAAITMALKVESGTLTPAAARLALAAGGYGPDVVARIDALEVHDHGESPEEPTIPPFAAECVQRLADEAGEGETIAEVLDRLMILWNSGRDIAITKTSPGHGARRQALVVTYSDSPDGPLSMFVDLEGEDGTALAPLAFTDAGRSLVVGLEAIAAKTEEAS